MCDQVLSKTKNLQTPGGTPLAILICGIVDLFFFGIGTLVAGLLNKCEVADVVIGLLQLFIPFVGWIWFVCFCSLCMFECVYVRE